MPSRENEIYEEEINNTILTVQQHAPLWDHTITQIDEAAGRFETLTNRVIALEIELQNMKSQMSELMRRCGMRCDSLL